MVPFLKFFEKDTEVKAAITCLSFLGHLPSKLFPIVLRSESQAFCYWKGDMEAHMYSHFLEKTGRYFKCNSRCDWCLATSDKRSPELSWGDLTLRALWRWTLTMEDSPSDPSPWKVVPRFEKSKRLLDLMHIVHLGTLRDIVASVLIDSLQDGSMGLFYGLQDHNDILRLFSKHAEAWARSHGMALYMGKLTKARLGRPSYDHWPYPILDSRVKAAKARTLLGFCTHIMCLLACNAPVQLQRHAQLRATMCWTLDVALSTFNLNKCVIMSAPCVAEVTWLRRLHLACYQRLSCESLPKNEVNFKIRPKSHYLCHLVDVFSQNKICLQHLSAFLDEDFMGKTRSIAQSCHGSTYHKAWARRYCLKRALQFRALKDV